MMDMRRIVGLWRRSPGGVLVTLVRVEGSSYRRSGARLLAAGGAHAGTISGGCLEADVVRRASWLARGGALVERYTTAFDDTAEMPFGLGCGGTVDLLFERADTPEALALLDAMSGALGGRELKVVSFLPDAPRLTDALRLPDALRPLRRAIYDLSGEVIFASTGLSSEKIACARGLESGREYEGRFVEQLGTPQRLFVVGAGEDARPLVELGALLGWTVAVADGRSQLLGAGRFAECDHVRLIRLAEGGELDVGRDDAVVLMTHSYEQDREFLIRLLPLAPRYLGLLGSRHRSSLLIAEAAATLGATVESVCERVFAPVGMDLGGDGPEAIALAIAAEVQAVCAGGKPSQRRLSAGDVSQQIEAGGASRYLQTQCALAAR